MCACVCVCVGTLAFLMVSGNFRQVERPWVGCQHAYVYVCVCVCVFVFVYVHMVGALLCYFRQLEKCALRDLRRG